jgi:hypothetical protein
MGLLGIGQAAHGAAPQEIEGIFEEFGRGWSAVLDGGVWSER